ncbi:substrate-binding periplasmic protein [Brevibacterium casei]|uniref:Sulfate starvation-induced protein 7 n=1 Tax=Brevibacterium casei TaxID=33889 RepID=A0A449D813_9MICO|nr:transporter substrate-binding domain-containing protein [Brevibacterium casei]MDH5149045.1 transporter substrate-binding domain-containing protein [Brevibacterium casei]VEW13592.1 Sulfate starvation-induced protein 7 [Brevibacterium casei]
MSKTSQIIIAIVAVIVLALVGGYFGAGFRSGGGAGGTENGAWLQKIRDQGELRVGIASAPPMTGEQPDGTMGGPNVLPLQNLADEMGVKFTPVAAEWSKMVSGLQADRFDVGAYLDATSERSLAIQFTDPVYTYEGVWIVKADSDLKSTDDIIKSGKPIAVASGTSYERRVQEFDVDIVSAEAIPQSISAMEAGRAVAAFGDLPTLADAAQKNDTLKIVRPNPVIFKSDSNYGVSADIDARSMEVLNIAIQNAKNDGSFQSALDKAGVIDPSNLGDLEMK